MCHLLAKRARLHLHRLTDAGHLVDLGRMGSCDIDHDGGVDLGAVFQRHTDDPTLGLADRRHFGIVAEFGTSALRRMLTILCGECGIVHIAAVREINAAEDRGRGRFAEMRLRGRSTGTTDRRAVWRANIDACP